MLCSRNLLGIPLRKLGEDVKGSRFVAWFGGLVWGLDLRLEGFWHLEVIFFEKCRNTNIIHHIALCAGADTLDSADFYGRQNETLK